MQAFFTLLGLSNLAPSQMLVIGLLTWASAFGLAWIADAILGDGAFGVLLNTSILVVGAVLGVILWRKLGFGPTLPLAQTLAIVATASGCTLLIICGVLRRWL